VNRNYNRWPLAVADYAKALVESSRPDIYTPNLELFVPDTVADATEWVQDNILADPSIPIAVDIENTWGTKVSKWGLKQIDCIGFSSTRRYAGACFPLFDTMTGKSYWSEAQEFLLRQLINSVLVDPKVKKIFQNGSFDVQLIWEKWRVKVQNYAHDTRLIHHALWPELPKDLGSMAATHTTMPGWKPVKGKRPKKED
jgi:hypothetical protein